MSKHNDYENDLLNLLFRATAIANVADDAATAPLTNIHFGLHTGDPGEDGDQTDTEAAYTSYARVAVARSAGGFMAASGGSISPVANVTFAQATGGSETETHFHVGSLISGTGRRFYNGTVTPNIVVTSGVQPILTTATAITED